MVEERIGRTVRRACSATDSEITVELVLEELEGQRKLEGLQSTTSTSARSPSSVRP